MLVVKLRADGTERIRYEAELIGREGVLTVVRTRWAGGRWVTPFVTVEPGDPALEYYRPGARAVYLRLMDRQGRLRGWYVDLTDGVEETGEGFRYRDAVLDLFVYPNGRLLVLDGDEFVDYVLGLPEGRGAWGTPGVGAVRGAVEGLQEALRRLQDGLPPFTELPGG